MKTNKKNQPADASAKKESLPGYPLYPDNEDIYNRDKEEEDLDPENISEKKPLNEKDKKFNQKTFKQDKTGGDLDIPGSELDDEQEDIGSEDEENNYYSLGDN